MDAFLAKTPVSTVGKRRAPSSTSSGADENAENDAKRVKSLINSANSSDLATTPEKEDSLPLMRMASNSCASDAYTLPSDTLPETKDFSQTSSGDPKTDDGNDSGSDSVILEGEVAGSDGQAENRGSISPANAGVGKMMLRTPRSAKVSSRVLTPENSAASTQSSDGKVRRRRTEKRRLEALEEKKRKQAEREEEKRRAKEEKERERQEKLAQKEEERLRKEREKEELRLQKEREKEEQRLQKEKERLEKEQKKKELMEEREREKAEKERLRREKEQEKEAQRLEKERQREEERRAREEERRAKEEQARMEEEKKEGTSTLYLTELSNGTHKPHPSGVGTFPKQRHIPTHQEPQCSNSAENVQNGREIQILENEGTPDAMAVPWVHAKLFQFHDNYRPPWYGTWKRKAAGKGACGPRNPFGRQPEIDYDYDSDNDWEAEPEDADECESDGDVEQLDEERECERDGQEDGFFVAHGYLSEGEGGEDDVCADAEERRAQLAAKAMSWRGERHEKSKVPLKPLVIAPMLDTSADPVVLAALNPFMMFKANAHLPIMTAFNRDQISSAKEGSSNET